MTQQSTRFEKVEWLLENCPSEFITECTFLNELVAWMDEDQFNEFHEHVCRNWDIDSPFAETDDEDEFNEFVVEDDEIVPA